MPNGYELNHRTKDGLKRCASRMLRAIVCLGHRYHVELCDSEYGPIRNNLMNTHLASFEYNSERFGSPSSDLTPADGHFLTAEGSVRLITI